MTDKPNLRVKMVDKVILSEYLDQNNFSELVTAGNNFIDWSLIDKFYWYKNTDKVILL